MQPYGYYSFIDQQSPFHVASVASDKYPLIVNCAGRYLADEPFVTELARGREDYYVLYVERGELEVFLDGSRSIARSGSTVIYPPHYPYKYVFAGNEPLQHQKLAGALKRSHPSNLTHIESETHIPS